MVRVKVKITVEVRFRTGVKIRVIVRVRDTIKAKVSVRVRGKIRIIERARVSSITCLIRLSITCSTKYDGHNMFSKVADKKRPSNRVNLNIRHSKQVSYKQY